MYHKSFLTYYQSEIEQLLANQQELETVASQYGHTVAGLIADEAAYNVEAAKHLIARMCFHLPSVIAEALERANNWLLSKGVPTPDGAWGAFAGAESKRTRVANTGEALFGILESSAVGVIEFSEIEKVVRKALSWTVARGRDPKTGAFKALSNDVRTVANTAMMIWLIAKYPDILTGTNVPVEVVDAGVNWLAQQRFRIGNFDFYGQYKGEAERVFSNLWVLRAQVAFVQSPFCRADSPWQVAEVEQMLSSFLQSTAFSSTRGEYLISLQVTASRPNVAMMGMLLTVLGESRAAGMRVKDADKVIQAGIPFLLSKLDRASWTWEDSGENYDSRIDDDESPTTSRAFSHMTQSWVLQALTLNQDYLSPAQKLVFLRCVCATLDLQAEEGYFRLLDPEQASEKQTRSIFGTAWDMFALAQVKRFAEYQNMHIILKSGLIVVRDNRLLVVQKRKSPLYLMPGGRIEEGETTEEALIRETQEELACGLIENSIEFFEVFEDVAANEPNSLVQIRAYSGQLDNEPKASSEIEKLIWFGVDDDIELLSPIIKNKIWPRLLERRVIISNPQ